MRGYEWDKVAELHVYTHRRPNCMSVHPEDTRTSRLNACTQYTTDTVTAHEIQLEVQDTRGDTGARITLTKTDKAT